MTKNPWLLEALGLVIFYSVFWWAFTDGSTSQLWLGALSVAAATAVTLRMPRAGPFPKVTRYRTILRFIPYFIYQSFKGGLLVAKFAFLPQRRVHSQYIDYKTVIPEEDTLPRMCFASLLCLIPGTLSCGYKGDKLTIHVLDEKILDVKSIEELDKIVAEIFGH